MSSVGDYDVIVVEIVERNIKIFLNTVSSKDVYIMVLLEILNNLCIIILLNKA